MAYNAEHQITPETIHKAIRNSLEVEVSARRTAREAIHAGQGEYDRAELISKLEEEMFVAAQALDFERAARLRDRLRQLEDTPLLEKLTRPGKSV